MVDDNMKNKITFLIIAILLVVGITICFKPAWSDSGWDTGYSSDSGGYSSGGYSGGGYSGGDYSSSDYSSSYDRSSRSSYNSNGNYDGSKVMMTFIRGLFIFIFVMMIIILVVSNANNISNARNDTRYKEHYFDMDIHKLQEIFPDETYETLKAMAYQKFIDIQNAWMNFDYDNLKLNCSDELYNTYHEQLEVLKAKNQQNIMTDFEEINTRIIDAYESDDYKTIEIYLAVSFYDYVEDEKKKIVNGSDVYKIVNHYVLTFIRTANSEIKNCPKCGAPLEDIKAKRCSYCRSKIAIPSKDFVLTKKINEKTTLRN